MATSTALLSGSMAYAGENCLALPKLNLQFLTFHDYLLRNFNLFRLEATYEIREDISDVIGRVGAARSVLWLMLKVECSSCRLITLYMLQPHHNVYTAASTQCTCCSLITMYMLQLTTAYMLQPHHNVHAARWLRHATVPACT